MRDTRPSGSVFVGDVTRDDAKEEGKKDEAELDTRSPLGVSVRVKKASLSELGDSGSSAVETIVNGEPCTSTLLNVAKIL